MAEPRRLRDIIRESSQQLAQQRRQVQPPQSRPRNSPVPGDLHETITVVLDGSGNGSVWLTPYGSRWSGLLWVLEEVSVRVSTNTNEAEGTLYISRGSLSMSDIDSVAVTETASTGATYATKGRRLRPGDYVAVKFSGGDPGSTATMVIRGDIIPPGVE